MGRGVGGEIKRCVISKYQQMKRKGGNIYRYIEIFFFWGGRLNLF
jgi:hypothetical protein